MKKIGLKSIGVFAVFAFSIALTSCGGSSGGGDSEIDFEVKDLVNKYWYYNGFVNSSYDASGVLLVYKFQGNSYDTKGTLVKQQFGGRIDETVGTWELLDDKLTIIDETIVGAPTQEWYLRKDATGMNLKLRGAGDLGGDRDFYSEISGLNDITADAFYSKVRNSDGSTKTYIGYEVVGNSLKNVIAMPNKEDNSELKKYYELVTIDGVEKERVVFKLDPENKVDYLEELNGENEIRFSMELEDGTELMLDETLSSVEIDALDYVRGYDPDTHVVFWNANLGSGVYYRVEVLDDNGKVVFRSLRQPDNSNGELSLESAKAEIKEIDDLKIEDDITIRISALKYEVGIDATNSSFKDSNIQAKSVYSYHSNW